MALGRGVARPMKQAGLAIGALLLVALSACSTEQRKTTWSANCGFFGKLSVDEFIRRGYPADLVSWGLYLKRPFGSELALYPKHSFSYVGWGFDCHSFSDPTESDVYTPMPTGPSDKVWVFDPHATVGATQTGIAPFMNIFVDPSRVSAADFATAETCLEDHRDDLNAAIARLPDLAPKDIPNRLFPLALGGIAYERPPLDDPTFMAMASASEIPSLEGSSTDFFLAPGTSAVGDIGGHSVRVTAPDPSLSRYRSLRIKVEIDGKPATARLGGWSDIPGVALTPGGYWYFKNTFCNCEHGLMIFAQQNPNSVGSVTLQVIPGDLYGYGGP